MKRKSPPVREYMTHLPIEAENCETIGQAQQLMKDHGIRHLPVMNGSHLVGLLSEVDIFAAQIVSGASVLEQPLPSVCKEEVLKVSPLTPVDEVARQMLAQSVDSAAVVDGGFVVGIFTVTDAVRCLAAWPDL